MSEPGRVGSTPGIRHLRERCEALQVHKEYVLWTLIFNFNSISNYLW